MALLRAGHSLRLRVAVDGKIAIYLPVEIMSNPPPRILLYLFSAIVWIVFLAYLIPDHYLAR